MDVVLFNQSDTQLTPEQDIILIDFFGYSSGVFVGITLLPQVIKVFKTKSTKKIFRKHLNNSFFRSSKCPEEAFLGVNTICQVRPNSLRVRSLSQV